MDSIEKVPADVVFPDDGAPRGWRTWRYEPATGQLLSLVTSFTWPGPLTRAERRPNMPVPCYLMSMEPGWRVTAEELWFHPAYGRYWGHPSHYDPGLVDGIEGLWSYKTVADALEMLLGFMVSPQPWTGGYVIGAVRLYGLVLEHERGWRAEAALIERLYLESVSVNAVCPCPYCEVKFQSYIATALRTLSRAYDVPVAAGRYVPVCKSAR